MGEKMTVYYMKSSGRIKSIISGVQSMDCYGIEKDDMSLIIDFVVVPDDEYVRHNFSQFYVNQNKEIKMRDEFKNLTKYM